MLHTPDLTLCVHGVSQKWKWHFYVLLDELSVKSQFHHELWLASHTHADLARSHTLCARGKSKSENDILCFIRWIECKIAISSWVMTSCTHACRSRQISHCVCTVSVQKWKWHFYVLFDELSVKSKFHHELWLAAHTHADLARSHTVCARGQSKIENDIFMFYSMNWV